MMRLFALVLGASMILSGAASAFLTMDPRDLRVETQSSKTVGLVHKSGQGGLLIELGASEETYINCAIASALSLETVVKIDKHAKKLYVGEDDTPVEKGWLIDTRFLRGELSADGKRNLYFFEKKGIEKKRIYEGDIRLDLRQGGFLRVTMKSVARIVEGPKRLIEISGYTDPHFTFHSFKQIVKTDRDPWAKNQPTIRFQNALSGEKEVRIVGASLKFQFLPRQLRLNSMDLMDVVAHVAPPGAFLVFKDKLKQAEAFILPNKYWRFRSGKIFFEQPLGENPGKEIQNLLEKQKRNSQGQGEVIVIPLDVNGRWAILQVAGEHHTLYVDWTGETTQAELDAFLQVNDGNSPRRQIYKMRPPNLGEDESGPMYEKLIELLEEPITPRSVESASPRDMVSPRSPIPVVVHLMTGIHIK